MDVEASALTRESFPVIDRLESLGPSPIETLYVISPDDIWTDATDEEITIEYGYRLGGLTPLQYNDFVDTADYKSPQVLRDFLDENYPELSVKLDSVNVDSLAMDLIAGREITYMFDDDISSNESSYAIIATSYATADKAFLASSLSGLPIEGVLPGTDARWREASILHEFGHVKSPTYLNETLRGEVIAEMDMNSNLPALFNGASTGIVQNFEHAMHGMRALSAFSNNNDVYTHITSAPIQITGEGFAPKGSALDFENGLRNAQDTVHLAVGQDIFSNGLYAESLTNIINGLEAYEGAGVLDYSLEDLGVFEQMLSDHENMFTISSALSDDSAIYFYNVLNDYDVHVGGMLAAENPALLYENMREVYMDGGFDFDPIAKQYAHEYLEAAQTYAPTLHNADPNEAFIAPEFGPNGLYMAPDVNSQPQQGAQGL